MAKRRRWKKEPLSGIEYEKGSLMDLMSAYDKPPKRYEYEEAGLGEVPQWGKILIVLIVAAAIVWTFVLEPFIAWGKQNWLPFLIIIVVVSFITTLIILYLWKQKRLTEETKKRFEQEQISKGLVKFIGKHGKEHWGKQEEVEQWKKDEKEAKEKESLLYRVIKEIKEFTPAKEELKHEYNYQLNLHGWLKRTFPSARIERQKGSSRPDIVIDKIAIEVKGPTRRAELDTIASKAMRYPIHYDHLLLVLFNLDVAPRYYAEWKEGLKRKFPEAVLIEK